jgi:Flp pilus assembly protein TadD
MPVLSTLLLSSAQVIAGPHKPLDRVQILGSLVASISSTRLADLIERRGIDFQAKSEYLDFLRNIGAEERLLQALLLARAPKSSLDERESDAKVARIETCLANSLKLLRMQVYPTAQEEVRKAIQLDPESAILHCALGNILAQGGQWESAVGEFRRGARLEPDMPDFHNALGVALANTHDLNGAAEEFQAAVQLDSHFADAHNNFGMLLDSKRDIEGAIAEYRAALVLEPDNPKAHNNVSFR